MSQRRREFIVAVLEAMHTFYRWGGDDPFSGMDCSGLVAYALWKAGGPDWRKSHNTDKLWLELPEPQVILPGDLCFYGGRKRADGSRDPADVSHVAVWLTDLGDHQGIIIDASGGDQTTVDQVTAIKQGAKVRAHRSHLYRSDFRGFRGLPLDD